MSQTLKPVFVLEPQHAQIEWQLVNINGFFQIKRHNPLQYNNNRTNHQ